MVQVLMLIAALACAAFVPSAPFDDTAAHLDSPESRTVTPAPQPMCNSAMCHADVTTGGPLHH